MQAGATELPDVSYPPLRESKQHKDNPQGICLWVVFFYFYGRNRYEQPDSYFGCRGGVLPAHRLPAADAGGTVRRPGRGSYPQLHDEGFAGDGQTFRLFTFGPLEGRYRVQGNEITFTGLVQLEVRSPVEDLLYALGKSLTGAGAARLGRCVRPAGTLRSEDHYWFAAPLPVRMVSPLTLHKSLPGGKTLFLRPDDDAFAAQLIANTAHKLAACRSTADPSVTLCPMGTRLPRKRVTQFKGIYLTGWDGDFLLDGNPETLCLLYQIGLGDRNSQGFGMFRLLL